jgi:hypothetical protein
MERAVHINRRVAARKAKVVPLHLEGAHVSPPGGLDGQHIQPPILEKRPSPGLSLPSCVGHLTGVHPNAIGIEQGVEVFRREEVARGGAVWEELMEGALRVEHVRGVECAFLQVASLLCDSKMLGKLGTLQVSWHAPDRQDHREL